MNITFPGLVNLYRHLRVEQRDVPTANLLRDCLTEITLLNKKTKADFTPQFVKAATKINELSKAIKTKNLEYSPIDSRNPEIRSFESQGNVLWTILNRDLKKDAIIEIIQKTAVIAQKHFPLEGTVEQILLREAINQDSSIRIQKDLEIKEKKESKELCKGLIGFYEIIMKRPALQYTETSSILLTFPGYLQTIVRSFSSPKETPEALAKLEYLVKLTDNNKDKLLRLCHESPETESMIHKLSSLKNKEEVISFYESLKIALLSESPDSGDVLSFINEEAEKISPTIPVALKGDMKKIYEGLADGFENLKNHGTGVKFSGGERIGMSFNHTFGDGLKSDAVETPIHASNPYSRGSFEKDKTRERIKEIAKTNFENYYNKKELISVFYTIMKENESFIERENISPLERALATVSEVTEYHLAQANTNIFELDRSKAPEFRKKVVLFGITNDIFPQDILVQLLSHFNLLLDGDVIQTLHAARARLSTSNPPQTDTPHGRAPENEEKKDD